MYASSQIVDALGHPGRIGTEVNLYLLRRLVGNDGAVDIFDEDWDNLVILDVCRYDAFAVRSSLPGMLSVVGTGPREEWMREQAARFSVEDIVEFYGFVSNERLPEVYANHDQEITDDRPRRTQPAHD
ncbi:hypothetical protein [Haladaptatus sp. NG-SE-30]